jgi:hypothetical protein
MLNFIISVIGQTYDRIMGLSVRIRYDNMAMFNEETSQVFNFFEDHKLPIP